MKPLGRAAIAAVGSELLTPLRIDTNSLFITEQLNLLGIDVGNTPSLGASRAAGHAFMGYAGFLRCLGRTLTFASPGARRCGFAFFTHEKGARPAAPPVLHERSADPLFKRR